MASSPAREVKIRRAALAFALEASRSTAPYEFIGLLRANARGEISEVLVIPQSVNGKGFSSIDILQLGYTSRHTGSIHSHPRGVPLPSRADLAFFRALGSVHLIVASPYTLASTRAYDSSGERLLIRPV